MADNSGNSAASSADSGSVYSLFRELISSPLNLALLGVCAYLLYKILQSRRQEPSVPRAPQMPPMKKRDFTLAELKQCNGRDGRILIAVNGKVFDVTRGKHFYGPGGPYGVFAGRDASRALATFTLTDEAFADEYDDLSNLSSMEMEGVREWEMQFTEKYDLVGRLLKPGEEPTDYTDTEEEHTTASSSNTDSTPLKSKDA